MTLDISRNSTGLMVCACCGAAVYNEIELGARNGPHVCGVIYVCSEECAQKAINESP